MVDFRSTCPRIAAHQDMAMKRHKTVDDFVASQDEWHDQVVKLREILNATGLEETVKWGGPCYAYQDKNVVGLNAFKSYVGLWFFQGALLTDEAGVLVNAQDGRTKAMRQWRFTSGKKIKPRLIKQYVREAIALVEQGKEIKPSRKRKKLVMPPELQKALAKNKKAKACYDQLTPGCQREYAEYIAEAKQAETKLRRIDKILPMVLAKKGLNDKYRKS
jgi:uncharacterized protein YdeI (YjbR/CyaY-like superfamily)